ncbi:MAG: hypothetical protein R2705_07675 [Ilumatobacteraceae bacterium]
MLLDEPGPGTAFIAAGVMGDQVGVSVWSYLYGDRRDEIVERDEPPRWRAWLEGVLIGRPNVRWTMRLTDRTVRLYALAVAEAPAWLPPPDRGQPLLDLSQAAPATPHRPGDRPTHRAQVATEPDGGRYAPPPGIPSLTHAFIEELSLDYGATLRAEQILPTRRCQSGVLRDDLGPHRTGRRGHPAGPLLLQSRHVAPARRRLRYCFPDEGMQPSVAGAAELILRAPRHRARDTGQPDGRDGSTRHDPRLRESPARTTSR